MGGSNEVLEGAGFGGVVGCTGGQQSSDKVVCDPNDAQEMPGILAKNSSSDTASIAAGYLHAHKLAFSTNRTRRDRVWRPKFVLN